MLVELQRYKNNPIFSPKKENMWESKAVMNPGVCLEKNDFHMLYRALSSEAIILPKVKEYHLSYIGYAHSEDGVIFERREQPFIKPEQDWEELGCEDARAVKIDDTYYIFYTAVSKAKDGGINVRIAGAVTADFERLEKYGFIDLQGRCKAASLFPEKVDDRYAFLYTQYADTPQSTIFYTEVESIEQLFDPIKWRKTNKVPLLTPSKGVYRGPELGASPVKTPKGWLLIYCPESFKREWFIGAALLDIKDPTKVVAKTTKPLLKPEMSYELKGYTDNVAFPSGAVVVGDELYVYYGSADDGCCLATCKLYKLLSSLT